MLETLVGLEGRGAGSLLDRATSLGAEVVVAAPGFTLLAAPGAARTFTDDRLACAVLGNPGVDRLPGSVGGNPAERIADGYRSLGEEALRLLRPPFALVVWDRSLGTGFAACDQLGSHSIFIARSSAGLALAGEVADVLRVLPARPVPDRAMLGSWIADRGLPRGRTLYAGVDRLPGGSSIALGAGQAAARTWGAVRARPTIRADEAGPLVRAAIGDAVRARTPADAGAAVLLSGGIDSCSVAAVTVAEHGAERTTAVSAVFDDRPETDESALIDAVTRRLGVQARQVRPAVTAILPNEIAYLERWQVPAAAPTLEFRNLLYRAAIDSGAAVVLDGEGGDELFGLREYLLADRLRRGRLASAAALALRYGEEPAVALQLLRLYGLRGAIPFAAHRLRPERRPEWLREDVRRELPVETSGYAWKARREPRWLAERHDVLTAQRERRGVHDYLRHRAVMAGTCAAHPFLDDLDLIELALALPPEHGFRPDPDRPALREAMRGELPEEVRLRIGKSYFNHLFEGAIAGPDARALEQLLGPSAEVADYVRPGFLSELLSTPTERRRATWSRTAWRLAVAECWLRRQAGVELRLPEAVAS